MNFLQSFGKNFSSENIISFFSTPKALWYVYAFVFVVYVIASCVLVFHWRSYGMGNRYIIMGQTAYFFVSVVLLILAAFFITLI